MSEKANVPMKSRKTLYLVGIQQMTYFVLQGLKVEIFGDDNGHQLEVVFPLLDPKSKNSVVDLSFLTAILLDFFFLLKINENNSSRLRRFADFFWCNDVDCQNF